MPVTFAHQLGSGYFNEAINLGLDLANDQERWKNTLFLPLLATTLSGGILGSQWIAARVKTHRNENPAVKPPSQRQVGVANTMAGKIRAYASGHGGIAIFGFYVARVLGSFALLGLSLVSLLQGADSQGFGWQTLFASNLPEVTLAFTYWYTSVLATLSLTNKSWSNTFIRHVNTVLAVVLAVYVYRDVWPLATFTERPVDVAEGPVLWAKVAVLTFTAVVVPLFVPRPYIPVDPENPMEVPNPEQTASLFSLMIYTYLNSIIFEAYRIPHLPADRLPPLRDDEYSKYMTTNAFPHLDPFQGAKRHIFWGLMTVFFWDFFGMALCLIAQTLGNFASPVAINRILSYLENDDEEFYIRPWFWVLALFFGPLVVSIAWQWYIFLGTRALTKVQCVLTELIFEHSLRIRFKAEPSGDTKAAVPATIPASAHASGSSEASTVVAGATTRDASRASTASVSTVVAASDADSTAAKGKAKDEPVKPAPSAEGPKKKVNLVGKINTLVTVDLENIVWSKDFLMLLLQVPFQLVLSVIFLYAVLGWSAMVGLASIVVFLPAPGYIARWMQSIHKRKMGKTDARVEAVTQTIGVIRMVKLFGWEDKMDERLRVSRDEELDLLFKDKIAQLVNNIVNFILPLITMIVTFATYTLVAKQPLNPSKVFSSITVFEGVRNILRRTTWSFFTIIKGKVALDRLGSFLHETELLDDFSEETFTEVSTSDIPADSVDIIGFNNAAFAWSKEAEDGTQTPSARTFRLQVPDRVTFKTNAFNLILGPTGSGKTSILMALLGEMHFVPSSIDSWYNLPRGGGIAYAAQESWVQNETIKNNILFGAPFDKERYDKVIYQCALETDLTLFDAGDETEVGEKGLTLSGGQKARVTLARAVYSSAQILLLDDILAALDVHTSKHIVNECLQGDLLKGRTIILVTHNVALTQHIADHIVAVGLDGVASEISDISELLAHDKTLSKQVELEQDEEKVETEVVDTAKKPKPKADGKLVLAEEIAEGHVSWQSISLYLRGLGGSSPLLFFVAWIVGMILLEGSSVFSVWFLGLWGSQYESPDGNSKEVNVPYYLGLYSAILIASMILNALTTLIYAYASQRASKVINSRLIRSILHSTFRWLDETPTSRIIARCTQDIGVIDSQIHAYLNAFINMAIKLVVQLAGPVIFTPIFLAPGLVITVLGVYLGNIYLKAQMSVKREMSNARAPVLAHLGAAIAGLVSLRAYGAQDQFKKESFKRVDHFTKVARTSYNLNRWIGIRLDLLGAIFTTGLASYLIVTRNISAANTGFSMNMAIQFCTTTLWITRVYNEFEIQANSLERIQAYLDIEHEPESTEAGKPPAAWPKSGELQVEQLSARYSSTGPKVLNDISFQVKSGERVGIVGRTGSGKSSLTLSLLRCILTDGEVRYDGISTKELNLDSLRSNVTIIPQVPELLSGTLRVNLDPFEQHDDATLNSALRASGLFSLQSELDVARLTLDSDISSGGNNLSVGQRQIIALARAIVRNSKLLILDEATSAIDHKTDSIIQTTLRNELASDTTVLTIAHRLQTIMDADKIMVLDNGRIVEYDSPQALLTKSGGYFKALVDESGDKKGLYAMAAQKASASGGESV